ncbi:MATE family efflux transporter [Paludicola sp. MB14-C6]|uniref:MATE family efflux transporter n=1 Tax=Paludihabitans sp. MB14-C6 TaxID=3070656 RepID=UPI0027DD5298|nr:MATE family efflux transporter [Paludicola sp. MB14-C6]WMJ22056.1 MATE family efflux transporter [Paludicola sp. MB14-C6]
MSKRINLLEGNIFTSLTKLAIPIMATSLIQMAYNLTDMIWIGQIGSNAVAAVGSASMFGWLSTGMAVLARMGGQVMVAQKWGAQKREEATEYASNSLQLGIFFSIVFGLIMFLFAKPLIAFFNLNSATVIADAEVYLKITGGAIIFQFVNQIFSGLITATGNSRTPFLTTTVGLFINIILDPVFIFGVGPIPPMGVAGAAWATIIAQGVVSLLFVFYAIKDTMLFHQVNVFQKPNWICQKEIIKIGFPTAIQSMTFTAISMIIARLIANFGDAAVAVQKVGSQIESISWMTADGFSVAINSFIAQNYGAKNIERAKKGYKSALSLISIWGTLSTLLLIFLAEPIFKIFITETAVIPVGVDYLVILGVSQLFMCVEIVTAGAFSGFGKTLPPSIVSITFTVARIPMALFLSSTALGLSGIWWSISISSILKGVILFVLFMIYEKTKLKETVKQ